MRKEPISVTLSRENLAWLRGQTRATARRGVSETPDRLMSEARTGGRIPTGPRSVVGTIRIAQCASLAATRRRINRHAYQSPAA